MKSFIIHLSRIEESRRLALNLQKNLKKYNIDSALFEGTYGSEAEEIFIKENRILHQQLYKGRSIKGVEKSGVKGCFYSHYRLWQKSVELNETIMVFEDDVKLYRGYESVDFQDILMISVCTEWKISKSLLYLLEENNENSKALSYDGECMIGTSGYIIKPHAAKKLLNEYQKTYTASDHAMNKHIISIEIHNKLMGRSLTKEEGKQSLTRSNIWKNYD